MKLITAAAFLISAMVLAVQAKDAIPDLDDSIFEPIVSLEKCPDVQYKCPECPFGSVCIYPDSGGCKNAGIPVCQSIHCFGILCLNRRLPCPEECPFTCRYSGSVCCPFIGQPVCEQPCMTHAPCDVTPCPEECPDDCNYLNADYCCPKSGHAVCKTGKKLYLPSPSSSVNDDTAAAIASLQVQGDGVERNQYEELEIDENRHFYKNRYTSIVEKSDAPSIVTEASTEVPGYFCPLMLVVCPPECRDTCLRHDVPCPFATEGYCPGTKPTISNGVAAVLTPVTTLPEEVDS